MKAGNAARGVIFVIQLYRNMISPLRLPTCRFMPTCSQYAVDALSEYGLIKGGWLAVVRLLKCGPWHKGGWDPIPEPKGEAHERCAHTTEYRADRTPDAPRREVPEVRSGSETRV
ncbi:membrane protein insertion efficiency factor YidD [Mycolicibacterium elephantis]|nr:membrane protein insertion efficiency factor YidD [Mycolicibacterium elephantis]